MSSNNQFSFNLIDKDWISVSTLLGENAKVSLLDLIVRAHELRAISAEMPQMEIALLRCAIAVLYRAYLRLDLSKRELSELWKDLWKQGRFDREAISEYLTDYKEGFDLFSPVKPFYQIPNLEYIKDGVDLSRTGLLKMILDLPSKEEKNLFSMRSMQNVTALSFDEAARYLVLAQAFDVAGIKSPVVGSTHAQAGKIHTPKGMVGTGWCGAIGGIFLEGNNLFETLMLNWPLFGSGSGERGLFGIFEDTPPWEEDSAPSPNQQTYEPKGPVQLLTWQSRRIRLVPDEEGACVTGVVMCYGDLTKSVDKQSIEMMTAWRQSKQQQKLLGTPHVPLMPVLLDPSKALWRGLSALLSRDLSSVSDLRPGVIRWAELCEDEGTLSDVFSTVTIHAQGFKYGTQNSMVDDVVDDSFSVSASMLRSDSPALQTAVEVVAKADDAVYKLVRFVQNVEKSAGDKRRYGVFGDSSAEAVGINVRERAYGELDGIFRRRLADFSSDKEYSAFRRSWMGEIYRKLISIAEDYAMESPVSAFREREGMSVGRAFVLLEGDLRKTLEIDSHSFMSQSKEMGSQQEGRKDVIRHA